MGNELFKNIPSKVGDLVKDVRNGRIGLPDLQRPFVWKDNKVRELFDSMLKGYPIGYIMLWESPADYESILLPLLMLSSQKALKRQRISSQSSRE